MKKSILAAIAATMVSGSAYAHTANTPHVCGVDPDVISEWPGYGTRAKIYDRGDYFFAVEVKTFHTPISYKHWNRVESITNHIRIYKDDCRVSNIEIVHTESKDEEVEAGTGVGGTVDRWSIEFEPYGVGQNRVYFVNSNGFREYLLDAVYSTTPGSEYHTLQAWVTALEQADQSIHDGATAAGDAGDASDYISNITEYFRDNIEQ